MTSISTHRLVRVKASLLSEGIAISPAALSNYGPPMLSKRRAYGNPDPDQMLECRMPQEVFLDAAKKIVCAVNVRRDSRWLLDWQDGVFVVSDSNVRFPVTFPAEPRFYTEEIGDGLTAGNLITLYGGSCLAIFASRRCWFIQRGARCKFCSLSERWGHDFVSRVNRRQMSRAISTALELDGNVVRQVMINGGNLRGFDAGFRYYLELAEAASEVLIKYPKVALHVILFPPSDPGLFRAMSDLPVSIAVNTEVFDATKFAQVCPGKERFYGRDRLLRSMHAAATYFGAGRVYSVFVGGLEPLASLRKGIEYQAAHGVVPVINVLHVDPNSDLQRSESPSSEGIVEMGKALQLTYQEYRFTPFYEGCGRNAIDYEASLGYF